MDFKCCLLASLLRIALISYAEIPSHVTDDVIAVSIYSNREQARRRENTQNGTRN